MIDSPPAEAFDAEFDLVVIGSGAAGLCAALTASVHGLRVLLCEKDRQLGGTTATSGGSCWVPNNHLAAAAGLSDDGGSAQRYLLHEIGAEPDGRRRAFLDAAPRAFAFIEQHSALKFSLANPYPDYHPDEYGAAQGARTLQPRAFDGRLLGRDFGLIRAPNPGHTVFGGLMVNRPEGRLLARPFASRKALAFAVRTLLRHVRDRLTHSRGTRLMLGNALVASLYYTLRERGVEVWTSTSLKRLLVGTQGVNGALVVRGDKPMRIGACRGVVLATGGFTSDPELRREFAGDHALDWALSAPGATGDGLKAARGIGAALEDDHAVSMFFMPVSVFTPPGGTSFAFPHIIADRARPGLIAVDEQGRRFVNEGDSYHDFVLAMRSRGMRRAFLVLDRRSAREYGIGVVRPVWQWLRWYVRTGYLVSAPDVATLAARIGAVPMILAASIAQHNAAAEIGIDAAFGKGGNALNRFNGDPSVKPNPCLRVIDTASLYAVAVYPAAIGASVGLRTDVNSRVMDLQGRAIEGLYACGNDQASVMRGRYPGAGITLGPAMTFAVLAAEHAAAKRLDLRVDPAVPDLQAA